MSVSGEDPFAKLEIFSDRRLSLPENYIGIDANNKFTVVDKAQKAHTADIVKTACALFSKTVSEPSLNKIESLDAAYKTIREKRVAALCSSNWTIVKYFFSFSGFFGGNSLGSYIKNRVANELAPLSEIKKNLESDLKQQEIGKLNGKMEPLEDDSSSTDLHDCITQFNTRLKSIPQEAQELTCEELAELHTCLDFLGLKSQPKPTGAQLLQCIRLFRFDPNRGEPRPTLKTIIEQLLDIKTSAEELFNTRKAFIEKTLVDLNSQVNTRVIDLIDNTSDREARSINLEQLKRNLDEINTMVSEPFRKAIEPNPTTYLQYAAAQQKLDTIPYSEFL